MFHLVNDPGSPGVTQLELSLKIRGRSLTCNEYELKSFIIEFIFFAVFLPELVSLAFEGFDNFFIIAWACLFLNKLDQSGDFRNRNIRTMQSNMARIIRRHKEHVS